MKKSDFKRASTVRLAREFLQQHKAITGDWRNADQMNALPEVADETVDEDGSSVNPHSPQNRHLQERKRPDIGIEV